MKNRDLVLFSLIIVGTVAAGLVYLNVQDKEYDAAQETNEAPVAADEIPYDPKAATEAELHLKKQEKIRTDFETTINTFLQNIDVQVGTYQRKRNTIRDMVKPENLRQFEYVAENKEMAIEVIVGMEADMDKIVASFPQADQSMRNFLNNNKPDELDTLLGQWEQVKNEQLELYVTFFSLEKELLAHYLSVFDIYAKSEGAYQVDVVNSAVTFSDASLTSEYMDVDRAINGIINREKTLLDQASEETRVIDPSSTAQPAPSP